MLRLTGIDITVCRECERGTLRRILSRFNPRRTALGISVTLCPIRRPSR